MSDQKSAKIQAEEKIMEALFEYAAACHVDNILAEHPVNNDIDSDFTVPPDFERRMKKLIAQHDRKELIRSIRKKTVNFLPKAAIFLLVLIGSLTLVVTSVQALRVKALNIIFNIKDQYTSVKTTEENTDPKYSNNEAILKDWEGYIPGYIPNGFKVDRTDKRNNLEIIYLSKGQGQTIRFTLYLSSNVDVRIDTEGVSIQNILIHNSKALLTEKEGLVSIVWKEEELFSLIGETDKEELIKMAQSIRRK